MSADKQEQQAYDALVETYTDASSARLVLEQAGFPASRIPAFSNAMVFWHQVASDARNGLLPGGIRPILEQAAKQWPHKPAFAPYAPAAASASSPSTTTAAASPKPASARIRIFISYSHEDDGYLKALKIRLDTLAHLLPIDVWDDTKINPGAKLKEEILAQLNASDVFILLISPNFMASPYCFSVEMFEALKRYEQNEGLPVPIIIRPEITWFDHQIGQHLALPKDGKAISKWSDPDDAWEDVTRGLKRLLTDLAQKRGLLPASRS